MEPDVSCYQIAMDICASAHDWERAVELLDDLEGRGLVASDACVSSVIRALEGAKKFEAAIMFLKDRQLSKVAPGLVTFNSVMKGDEKFGNWKKVMGTLDAMPDYGVSPNAATFEIAMRSCIRAGEANRALQILKDMPQVGITPTEVHWGLAIKGCGDAGDWQRAMALLEEMRLAGFDPDAAAYTAAIDVSKC